MCRARNCFSLLILRGHYEGLILTCSSVKEQTMGNGRRRHGAVCERRAALSDGGGHSRYVPTWPRWGWAKPGKTWVGFWRLAWETIYLTQSPCKSKVANPILHPMFPMDCVHLLPVSSRTGMSLWRWQSWHVAHCLSHLSPTPLKITVSLLQVGCLLLKDIKIWVNRLQIYSHPTIAQ